MAAGLRSRDGIEMEFQLYPYGTCRNDNAIFRGTAVIWIFDHAWYPFQPRFSFPSLLLLALDENVIL